MSNRKPARASTRSRSPKTATRAQRTKQPVIRSRKGNPISNVAAGSAELPPTYHNDPKHEAPIAKNSESALPDDIDHAVRSNNDSKKGSGFSLATPNVPAYQAKLLEMAQANVQFAFEFVQRLAAVKSPFEITSIIAEFTAKRIDMFRKFSQEMVELSSGEKQIPK